MAWLYASYQNCFIGVLYWISSYFSFKLLGRRSELNWVGVPSMVLAITLSRWFFFFCLDYHSTEDLTCCSFSDVDSPLGQAFNSSLATTDGAAAPAPPSQHGDATANSIWVPPKKSKMPSLKTFRLTKELVEQRVKDNVIIVTFGNYAFMDFILSWVKHLTELNLSNLLVGKWWFSI